MEYLIDLHVHSNASSHAYSTVEELIAAAKNNYHVYFYIVASINNFVIE